MRGKQIGMRKFEKPYVVLILSLGFIVVVFSGLSPAQTYSGRTGEFTLIDYRPEPTRGFSLSGPANVLYPLCTKIRNISDSTSSVESSESATAHYSRDIEESSKDKQGVVLNKPPLKQGKIIGEFIAGTALGVALGIAAAYIGASISYDGTWFSELPGAAIGLALAYPLGSAMGVYLVGNIGNDTGSFASALGAAYGGLILGAVGAYALSQVSGHISTIAFLVAPPLLATFAFNKSRHYKNPAMRSVSLLNFRDGGINLQFPAISVSPNTSGSSGLDWYVNLASVEF